MFLKYALSSLRFSSPEHEKAWLIRVTVNACKDLLKSFFRSRTVPLEELLEQSAPPAAGSPGGAGGGAVAAGAVPGRGVPPLL